MDNTRALAIINQRAGNSLMFATKEEVENVSPQYEPVVTVLELSKDDFTDVGMGNMYPGKSATNKIADASGVSFIPGIGGTREEGSWASVKLFKQSAGEKSFWQARGEFKVIGVAQGQRLKPDGSPRFSSVREYEFNPLDRANEDFLKAYQAADTKYDSEISALKHLGEVKKFATQRASTGAQLAVIRELAGIPTAFKKGQLFDQAGNAKAMVFSQTIENTRFKMEMAKEIMKTPDGRKAMADAMFGNTQALYGPRAAGQIQAAPPAETIREAERFDEEPVQAEESPATDSRLASVVSSLSEWAVSDTIKDEVGDALQAMIDRGEARLEILDPVLELVQYLGDNAIGPRCAKATEETLVNPSLDTIILGSMVTKARANVAAIKAAKTTPAGSPA